MIEMRTFGGTKVERPRRAIKLIVNLDARSFEFDVVVKAQSRESLWASYPMRSIALIDG